MRIVCLAGVGLVALGTFAGCGGSERGSGLVYRVPSGSMEPTFGVGERVSVHSSALQVGDVAIYHPPEGAEQQECGPRPHVVQEGKAACSASLPAESTERFIKRIVAGPGDELYLRSGHVFRKPAGSAGFTREADSYIRPCATGAECDFPTPITVPRGEWYMLGDNRGESDDSRFYGPIPTAWILGTVKVASPGG